tara:strand:- start:189 stop:1199 length:1011 start_codon:yes stop_codon:yes gene_type:complete
MASTIKIKRSLTPGSAPAGSSLAAGEIAINFPDRIIYGSNNGTDILKVSENALANTNTYIATKVDTTTHNAALANTNSYIATRLANVVEDTTPQLGGDLDVQTSSIVSATEVAFSNTTSATVVSLKNAMPLRLWDSDSSGFSAFQAPSALTGNTTFTLPDGDGSADQYIKTDGAGTLSWASQPASTFTLAADSGTNDTFSTGGTLTFNGTANEIATTVSDDAITLGLAHNVTVSGNTIIEGNLTVNGTTTTVTSSTVSIDDSLLKLSANNAADTVDSGFYVEYNDGSAKYAGLMRDANDSGVFKLQKGLTTEPTTTADFSEGSLATLDAVIDGGTY